MKKIFLLCAMAGFFVQIHAQDGKLLAKDVPSAVTTAFYKTYPSVKDVDWNKDGINFQAEYDADKVDNTATYTETGMLVNTGVAIVASALPASVLEYVKVNYKEDELRQACKITDVGGIVTFEGKVKGMDLTFDSNGNFIKSVKN
jgi:hypothetical protein